MLQYVQFQLPNYFFIDKFGRVVYRIFCHHNALWFHHIYQIIFYHYFVLAVNVEFIDLSYFSYLLHQSRFKKDHEFLEGANYLGKICIFLHQLIYINEYQIYNNYFGTDFECLQKNNCLFLLDYSQEELIYTVLLTILVFYVSQTWKM